MAPVVTATRVFHVPGFTTSDGFHFVTATTSRRSAAFDVAGYDWSIHYCPRSPNNRENMALCLQIETKENASKVVTASFAVSILDPTGSLPPWKIEEVTSAVFDPNPIDTTGKKAAVSMPRKFQQDMAPDPRYFTKGSLLFGCTITVFTDEATPATPAAAALSLSRAKTPNSDMMEHLGKIYETEAGADVTHSVKGKLFRAHKVILAMRSPVFKAELYGGMMESTAQIIEVQDMQPDVFKALLCYIYTDALPAPVMGDGDEVDEGTTELISRLLVASDRYGVERLRILCAWKLCDLVGADNWVRMLVFAQEQHCDMIKDACIEFMATSDRAGKVVASEEYAQLRRTHPMILIDALEKLNEFRENKLNLCFREMEV